MATFSSTSVAHFLVVFSTFFAVLLLPGALVEATRPRLSGYRDYTTAMSNGEKLFDAMTLQSDFSLSAIKELIGTKKMLDAVNMNGDLQTVIDRVEDDICDWFSGVFTDFNCAGISAMDDLYAKLEMRESAIRNVQDEVKSFVDSTNGANYSISPNKKHQCAWINNHVLGGCPEQLTDTQRDIRTFLNNGPGGVAKCGVGVTSPRFYLCN